MKGGVEVTLVVPVRDEERSFGALQRSIEAQSRPPESVIFVDAGSRDRTLDLVQAACSRNSNWRLIEAGPSTPGRARNVGIEAVDTDWVALTDAGIVLDRPWLTRLVRFVDADASVDVVYGHYEPSPGSWFTDCAALVYVAPSSETPVGPVRDHSIVSCLLRRDLWTVAGGFPDLRAAEDQIFMRRLEDVGARVAISAEAVAWWQLQPTLRSTVRRFHTYSRVNVLAGQQEHWHHRVRRMYVVAGLILLAARVHDRRWVLVPVAGGFLRAGHGIWERREGRTVWWAINPARVLTTLGITLAIDAATFTGWIRASFERTCA